MNRHPDVRLQSSELVYSARVFDVRREQLTLPSGLKQDLTIIDHPGAVAIAAQLDDGRLVLVRQYRHAVGDWLVELPAGRIERDEDPLVAAQRELEEETGYRSEHWSKLAEFFAAPGFCSELMTVFHARDVTRVTGAKRAQDPDEELEIVRCSPSELLETPPRDAKTWLAAQLLFGRAQ
ncbi:MAG: NUDIX hydrolase [Planctomycetes bacterium]|nr:NUDIX hydrolase [Planctomycetota bacterium]